MPNRPWLDAQDGAQPVISSERVLVVVGANGSGKSTLARMWDLSQQTGEKVFRISSQRLLRFDIKVPFIDPDEALARALGDDIGGSGSGDRYRSRWAGARVCEYLDDVGKILTFLYSDHIFSKISRSEKRTCLENVKDIFEAVMDGSVLDISDITFKGGKDLKCEKRDGFGGTSYPRVEMLSDGERAVVYFAAAAMMIPSGWRLVVDEPEIGFHRGLLARFWDALEEKRSDCQFTYLTHDVEFVVSRVNATRVWLKGMKGGSIDWDLLPSDKLIDDQILFKIVGRGRKVLLVEGDYGSRDYRLYRKLFSGVEVVPVGGCGGLRELVSAFGRYKQFSAIRCFGVTDRDYWTEAAVNALAKKLVFLLPYSEVENFFLDESVLQYIFPGDAQRVDAVKTAILERFSEELEVVLKEYVKFYAMHKIQEELAERFKCIDWSSNVDFSIAGLCDEWRGRFVSVKNQRNYADVLLYYPNKGLIGLASRVLKLNYEEEFWSVIGSSRGAGLIEVMRRKLPNEVFN